MISNKKGINSDKKFCVNSTRAIIFSCLALQILYFLNMLQFLAKLGMAGSEILLLMSYV